MRWRILALLCVARAGLGFQFQTVGSVGDALSGEFGLDYAGVGLMIGLFMAPGFFLSLPAGAAGRYLTDRILAGGGLVALALGGVLSATASDDIGLGLGRVLSGVGFLFATVYFTKMVADWFEGREIATAMSILVMSWPLGIAAGQVGHSWLGAVYGWRIPFLLASAYCLVTALAVLVLYRAPERAQTDRAATAGRLNGQEWRLILCAGLAWACLNGGYVVYLSFGPKMLETLGQPPLTAAWIISMGSWLTLLSFAVCGQIVDRFGHRNAVLTLCMLCAMGALGLLSLPGGGMAGSILFGLFGLAPAGVVMALAGEALRPQNRAFGMGVFFTIYYAVMLAVPPLAGWLLDSTGDVRVTIAFGLALFGAVLPAVWVYRRYSSTPDRLSPVDALGKG